MPIGNFFAVETASEVDLVEYNTVTMQDAIQFGQPTDTWTLTGQSFKMEIKASPDDAAALVSFTSAGGQINILDATNRIIQFNVPEATFTASLPVGDYYYDLVMFDTSVPPIRTLLMFGKLCVRQGVTES